MGMRQAGAPPVFVHVVTPEGKIRDFKVARNIAHDCLQYEPARATGGVRVVQRRPDGVDDEAYGAESEDTSFGVDIKPLYARAGWALLRDLYAQDPDPELREHGYQHFRDWWEATCEGYQGTRETKEVQGGIHGPNRMRSFPKNLPDELLPAGVVARREGKTEFSKPVYEAPKMKRRSDKKAKAG